MQSKKGSFIEQSMNVGSGFILALLFWQFWISWQIDGREMTWALNLQVTLQFTVLSFV